MPQVIALGDINLDLIAHIPYYPQPGEGGLAHQARLCSGGSAANTAMALARCGVGVGLIARVGRDALAAKALVDLEDAGVDGGQIQYDPELSTGMMFIAVTPDGERTMFGYRGANVRLDPALLEPAEIARAQVLHISGYALLESPQRDAALRALDIARQAGLTVSLDVGVEVAQSLTGEIRDLLPAVDWIFPNKLEAESLIGHVDGVRSVERLLGFGLEAVILKLGEMGCVIGTADGVFAVAAFDVPVRDSTGAGDSFNAGIIAGRLGGLNWRASGLLANALGGLATSVDGVGEWLSGSADVMQLLSLQANHKLWHGWQSEFQAVQAFLEQVAPVEPAKAVADQPLSATAFPQLMGRQGAALYG